MKVRSDPICPLGQEEEETALHLLGRCSALSITKCDYFSLLGLYCIDYTDLDNQSFQEISLASGLSGKHNGPTWWSERWMLPTGNIRPEGKVM